MPRPDATAELTTALEERILMLDGAMGTTIRGYGLTEEDARGERFKDTDKDILNNGDILSLTRPRCHQVTYTADFSKLAPTSSKLTPSQLPPSPSLSFLSKTRVNPVRAVKILHSIKRSWMTPSSKILLMN